MSQHFHIHLEVPGDLVHHLRSDMIPKGLEWQAPGVVFFFHMEMMFNDWLTIRLAGFLRRTAAPWFLGSPTEWKLHQTLEQATRD